MRTLKTALVFVTALAGLGLMQTQALANDWDLTGLEFADQATTKEVVKRIKEKVERDCISVSKIDQDKITLVDQVVNQSIPWGGQYVPVRSEPVNCVDDLPCNSPAMLYRYSSYTLQDSEMMLMRAGQRDGKVYSYTVKAEVTWDFDLPMPMPYVQLTSDYCAAH